ncbi:hypothetical protein [uncultured Shewanella sp.]|uniref:hypothetical protein n=1 Tax=uncultured Shewanella sp. TaxID=173975 RepID=UPI002608523E|nr:hypothetical protein [uncultured Shewanella sp.]
MSTEQTADLIESVTELTATVAGKMGDIDNRMTQAETDYQTFKDEASTLFQHSLTENGDLVDLRHLNEDKFYALVFSHPRMLDVRIRRYVHQNGQSTGLVDFLVRLQNWSNGGDYTFAIQEHHAYSHKEFIGKVRGLATPYYSGIWLRGGDTYNLYLNGKHEGYKIIEEANTIVESIGDNHYFAPPISEVDASVVPDNYIRGVTQ